MKAVADTLAVARSNLMSRRAKSRRPYRKAGDDELSMRSNAQVLRYITFAMSI
jgi:hypothetical protein